MRPEFKSHGAPSTFMSLQDYCKREKAWVQPLEKAYALWGLHNKDRVIMVEYGEICPL